MIDHAPPPVSAMTKAPPSAGEWRRFLIRRPGHFAPEPPAPGATAEAPEELPVVGSFAIIGRIHHRATGTTGRLTMILPADTDLTPTHVVDALLTIGHWILTDHHLTPHRLPEVGITTVDRAEKHPTATPPTGFTVHVTNDLTTPATPASPSTQTSCWPPRRGPCSSPPPCWPAPTASWTTRTAPSTIAPPTHVEDAATAHNTATPPPSPRHLCRRHPEHTCHEASRVKRATGPKRCEPQAGGALWTDDDGATSLSRQHFCARRGA